MSDTQSHAEEFDLLVLGSGEAGKYLAWTMARKGQKVAVIERQYIGGSCPNIACLPSKNVIHSAKIASYFRRSEEFGIFKDAWRIEMAGVRQRKRTMVDGLVEMHQELYRSSGAQLIMGSGRFVAPKTIEVASADGSRRLLRGQRIIICTGSRTTIDATPGLAEANPLTHIEALELDRVPEHLLILGGGYIGMEFAQAMRRFGAAVTVLDQNPRLVHREDEDVSEALQTLFQDEGINIVTGARLRDVAGKSGQSVHLRATVNGGEIEVEGSHLLVAAGRTPNTDNLGLDLAGVELTPRGHVKVNERLETSAPEVWAVGDCAGSPHFTHIAFDDFRIVRDNLAGGHRVTTGRQVPYCLFTDPEFARIGLNETEARAQGVAYRLAKIPMQTVLRTRTISETRGFMKVLVDARHDQILGFAMFGAGADEVIPAVQIAMLARLPFTVLRDAIFTHPTLAEGFVPLFSKLAPPAAK